ncbi:MAG: DUF2865 domain-containing protein [Bauldia sp.]|nr:DUF2865 domain-containing protein [Bauldia sp.]
MARLARLVFLVLVLAAAEAGAAGVQSPVCADLQSQYLSLLRATGSVNVGQRMLDMDRIGRELGNAQAAARQGNCNRLLFFGPKPSPQCPAIMAAIGRLRQQLAGMRGQQGFGLFGRSPEFEKARLRDWLTQYGCDIPALGGLRTICVRTCDGYYFPISFSTNRQQFGKDAAVCQAMYGEAGPAELFSYGTNTDVANAASVSGARYGDQPYAFLYRQQFVPMCAAQLKNGLAALGERYWATQGRRTTAAANIVPLPMPNLRPSERQEDPETIANRAGRLPVAPYAGEDETTATASAFSVRQVGEPYYAELFDPSRAEEPPKHRPPLGFDLIGAAMATEARETAPTPPN